MTRRLIVIHGLSAMALSCLFAMRASAQEPSLDQVLRRAAEYVADFHRKLSGVVSEERYVQDWWPGRAQRDTAPRHRVLLSDLLLVKPDGFRAWMEFRDVFEVDGQPVRERGTRLEKMFLEPSESTAAQIASILDASSRFNIGDLRRNLNTPVFSLLFLEQANRGRFKFKRTGDRSPKNGKFGGDTDAGVFKVSTEVWVVEYREVASGTMIRTDGNRDLPCRGRFWIEPDTGRVLMSELIADTRIIHATIDVSYKSEPLVGLLLPVEMRERYTVGSQSRIDGRATYGRFRQFQVKVDEKLGPIKK